jgi:hypothetical protein
MVIRSANTVLIQSGTGASAIKIPSTDIVGIP